jgi:thiol-disulfide isomerase/thioredoxin
VRAARIAGALVVGGLCAMLALNLVWIARNAKSLGGTRAGQPAPPISLPLLDSSDRADLRAARGHTVVLSFWATWCGPCVHELPDVQKLHDELSPRGVIFYAVNVEGADASEKIREFRQRLGLRMPIALDDGSASQAFRVDTIPRTVVIDGEGRVVRSLDGARSLDEMREAALLK